METETALSVAAAVPLPASKGAISRALPKPKKATVKKAKKATAKKAKKKPAAKTAVKKVIVSVKGACHAVKADGDAASEVCYKSSDRKRATSRAYHKTLKKAIGDGKSKDAAKLLARTAYRTTSAQFVKK
jgi:hypothetical protein